jgi:4-carboxymuconolactone decarboxylase
MPLDRMTPEQRAVADAILTGPRASSLTRPRDASPALQGPFEALLHSPGLADPAQRLGAFVRFDTSLPKALNEMAIIMVARRWTAQFEWYAHRRMALDAGLDPAVADAIATGATPDLDPDGTAVYEFVTELLERGGVDDAAFAAVESRWGKRGAADLIGAVGYYTLVSFVLNVDRYPLPDGEVPLGPR